MFIPTPTATHTLHPIGTTLAILGRTSPLGANYTVTLDNGTLPFSFPASSLTSGSSSVSTTLSARSSFQVDDALLFFVTGLEGGVHSVEVRNNGFGDSGNGDGGAGDGQAELMLRVDGFRVNVPVVYAFYFLVLNSATYFLAACPHLRRPPHQLTHQRLQITPPFQQARL
ncbi:hypothetical protein NLJ89_g11629 [Agrocybe chaxingu]|uniref:Uncharacterized protein n=1 Tax=Agrocybe chaxingu TaxID=84603 RepID=A0A9W8JS00_9AGAR|nr:hypothetical protein NLJ89_g11629 [Agrocybe chaxingu]